MTRQEYIELVKQVWPNAEIKKGIIFNTSLQNFCFTGIKREFDSVDFKKLRIDVFAYDSLNNFISIFTKYQITE